MVEGTNHIGSFAQAMAILRPRKKRIEEKCVPMGKHIGCERPAASFEIGFVLR